MDLKKKTRMKSKRMLVYRYIENKILYNLYIFAFCFVAQ